MDFDAAFAAAPPDERAVRADLLGAQRARIACVVRCVLAFGVTALASAQRLSVATHPVGIAVLVLYCCFSVLALYIAHLRPDSSRLLVGLGGRRY